MVEYSYNGINWTSCCVSFRHTYDPTTSLVYLNSPLPKYLNVNGATNVHIPANTILLNIMNDDVNRLVAEGIFKLASKEDCARFGRGVTL